MSKDGIGDDDRLAPDGSGADRSAEGAEPAGVSGADLTEADILSDPEADIPDALDVEAEIESATVEAGLETGTSDEDPGALGDDDSERVEESELAVAAAGSSRVAGRRGSVRAGVTAKKVAPTKARDVSQREGPIGRLTRFLREVVAELRKVIWPSRKQMATYTLVVIVFLIVMVALVSGMDVLFHLIVGKVLG